MRRFSKQLEALALRGAHAPGQHPHGRVVRQFHDVQHQGHGFVAGVVGAVAEVHARTLHAARRACDQVTHGDVE